MSRSLLKIRVTTHGGLGRDRLAGLTDDTVVVDSGTTLAALLPQLGIDSGLIGVVVSEGRFMRPETELEKECAVDVYPMFGGG